MRKYKTHSESIFSNSPPNFTLSVSFHSFPTSGSIPSPRSDFSLTKISKTQVFLYGGCDEEDDLNDGYILDLPRLKWTKVFMDFKTPLVGHAAISLNHCLTPNKPYVFIFGGWQGSGYSDKSVLFNIHDAKSFVSDYAQMTIENAPQTLQRTTISSFMKLPSVNDLTPPQTKSENNLDLLVPPVRKKANSAFHLNLSPRPNPKTASWLSAFKSRKSKTDNDLSGVSAEKFPFARKEHTMTFDPEDQKIYLYGGWNALQWKSGEEQFVELWSIDSRWRWTKEKVKGDIPLARRGHTATYLNHLQRIIIYGGCSGYNQILDDCYEYNTKEKQFTKIEGREIGYWPEGRAWHTAELIDSKIYYYGGMSMEFKPLDEVIAFDIFHYEWVPINCSFGNEIIERFGHSSVSFGKSILIMGGTTHVYPKTMELGARPEKKVDLGRLLVCETDEEMTLREYVKEVKSEQSTQESLQSLEESSFSIQMSSDFLDWNPHIFPHETNKSKIEYLQSQIEQEGMQRKSVLSKYTGFEGLEEEDSYVPIIIPKSMPIIRIPSAKEGPENSQN